MTTTKTTTLVLGATGKTGRLVVSNLRAAGHSVRPASRSSEVRFDWSDESTWDQAVTGAAAAYVVFPEEDIAGSRSFVPFAVERGVRRLVVLSGRGADELGEDVVALERSVRESGVEWTLLRPDWFDQNFDQGMFRDSLLSGELRLPAEGALAPFVDIGDIAAVATAALTDDRHAGRTYELTGPRALSFGEAVDLIAKASGKRLVFTNLPAEEFVAEQVTAGVPEEWARLLVTVFDQFRSGKNPPTEDVASVLGRAPVSFEDYAARTWGS